MARKSHDDGGGGQEWMNTYSDLVTLLMTFFVLLFSMSSVDADKWEAFVKAFVHNGDATSQVVINPSELGGDAPLPNMGSGDSLSEADGDPSELPSDFNDLFAALQKYVEEHNLESAMDVVDGGDNVVYIRFHNNIFFAPDKADLLAAGREVLDYLGDCLVAVQNQIYMVSINGHTADVGIDDYAISEWLLSGERACQVADFLDNEKDFEPTKLRPMGYGKSFPVADNSTEEGRVQNRRVDITIIRDDSSQSAMFEQQLADLFDPSQFPKTGGTKDLFSSTTTPGVSTAPANSSGDAASQPAGEEIPPPASSDTGTEIPPPASSSAGEVIPPPASSSAGEVIPPPASSSSGAVIPPPSSAAVGELQTMPIAGSQN